MKLVKKSFDAEVPTSSMADIAFLLIVFFMLTTVFSSTAGLVFFVPPETETGHPESAIFINIHPSGAFTMDGTDYSWEQTDAIFQYVSAKLQVNAAKPVILYTNPEAAYGHMIAALDQIKNVERILELPVALTIPSKSESKLVLGSL